MPCSAPTEGCFERATGLKKVRSAPKAGSSGKSVFDPEPEMGGLFPKAASPYPWYSFRRYNFLPTLRSDKYLLRGNGLMEIFGAAIGIVVGLAILAIALWELPNFRQHAFYSPHVLIMVFAILGGWVGYRAFSFLFHG
jgi:hypothetical protein